ncbi:MAG: HRDC domain-containing protein [Verrucomicrobiota bacterium]
MIDTEEKLAAFLPVVRAADWIAVDTEADSLHAYPEKVCLIQISTSVGDRLVDPLAGINIDPLLDALSGHQLIMHAADYDMRLLYKHHAFTPGSIFDTMLAARLLGMREFGLGALVEKILGVKLDKGPQKADWARRPLTERMEVYARHDTHYLKKLANHLTRDLTEKHRLDWHTESCARLIAECSQPPPDQSDTIWRIKGSHILNRAGLAVMRELWQWREDEAITANRPPFFILAHEKMVAIAEAAATNQPIEPIFPRHLSPRRREGIAKAIKAAFLRPPDTFPQILRNRTQRPSEAERRRYQVLEERRDAAAHALGLDATIIASRSVLGDLARDWDKHAPELMKWQRQLLQG